MSLNWLELNEVLSELPLEGCFLQNIRQTSFHHILMELYRPGRTITLLVCLKRDALRIHETQNKYPSLGKPPRFTSFLRSRIKGCRLEEVTQLGEERIIRFTLKKGNDRFLLYIRLWGGASNLILCQPDGTILDAFSRRPARKEVPGEIYCPEKSLQAGSGSSKEFALREELRKEGESYNAALDRFYQQYESSGNLDQLKQTALKQIEMEENQYEVKLKGLTRRLEEYRKEEELRRMGDTLMGALHEIRKGEKVYSGESGEIPLDPRKTPVENAQDYYKRAGKASRGRVLLEEETDLLQKKLSRLAGNREKIRSAETEEELAPFLPRSEASGQTGKVKKTPGLTFFSRGFTLLVGRTADENDELLRRFVRGNDFWLHTRDYAGGYVFIKTPRGKSVPLEVLLDAGNLAVFYSKAKKAGQGDIYYTQVKYLRRPKEGKKGLVLPVKEKNLYIKLEEARIERLKDEAQ